MADADHGTVATDTASVTGRLDVVAGTLSGPGNLTIGACDWAGHAERHGPDHRCERRNAQHQRGWGEDSGADDHEPVGGTLT